MPSPVASFASAAAAYRNAARPDASPTGAGIAAEDPSGTGFADLVKSAVHDAIGVAEHSEQASLAAVAGNADITEVVTAIAEAEVTLHTVVAVRDKFVQAYQEILRMPV